MKRDEKISKIGLEVDCDLIREIVIAVIGENCNNSYKNSLENEDRYE